MTACTPNESEVEQLLGIRMADNSRSSRRPAANPARAAARARDAGPRMALFERDRPTTHIPIFGSDQIADVTGAGDTVDCDDDARARGGRRAFLEAARLANCRRHVVERGTATVSADELRQAILSDT